MLITTLLYAENKDENSYNLGEGVQVASLLSIGAYFSFDYRKSDSSTRYRLDDVAFLAYGGANKFSYMAELEFKEFYVTTITNKESIVTKDTKLHTERLYVDYNANENYMFRTGKYNSPIGYWNLLPVNALRDTTSNPNSTYIIYPQYTTGLLGSYSYYKTNNFTIDIMIQNNSDIDPEYNNYEIDKHYGVGISYEKDNFNIKLNAGTFNVINYYNDEYENGESDKTEEKGDGDNDKDDETETLSNSIRYYALLSAKYDNEKFQLMTEIGSQKSSHKTTTEYAGYIQALYRFTQKHTTIFRVESYHNKINNKSDDFALLGFTYRPLYPIALKTEYQLHSNSKDNKILLSFSMMF